MTEFSLGLIGLSPDMENDWDAFLSDIGCEGLAVLPALPQEETGHADMFVQFLSPSVVAISEALDPQSELAGVLEEAESALAETARGLDQELFFVHLPMPHEGAEYFSYVNSLRVRDTLLVPSYSRFRRDLEPSVLQTFRGWLPGVRIVPTDADEMIELGGALHCMALGLLLPDDH